MSAAAPVPDLAPLDLVYRADLGVLVVRWLRDVTFEELQAGFQAAATLAHAHGSSRWLVDVRRRTLLDGFQSEWVAQKLLPQTAAALAPAPLRVAYLLAPVRFSDIRVQPAPLPVPAFGPDLSSTYRLRTFSEEGPAMQWLLGAD